MNKFKHKFQTTILKLKLIFHHKISPKISQKLKNLPQPVVQQAKISPVYFLIFFITYKILNNFYGIGPYNYYAMNRKYFTTENVSISVDSLGNNIKHARMVSVGKVNRYLNPSPPEAFKGFAVILTDDNKGLGVNTLVSNGILNDLLSFGYNPIAIDWPSYGQSPEFTPENNAVIYDSVIFLENILMYYNINPDDAIIVFSGAMARHVLPFISVHPSYFKGIFGVNLMPKETTVTEIESAKWKLAKSFSPAWMYYSNQTPQNVNNGRMMFKKMAFCEIKPVDEMNSHSAKEIYQQNAWFFEEIRQVRGWLAEFDKFLVKNYPEKFTKKIVVKSSVAPVSKFATEAVVPEVSEVELNVDEQKEVDAQEQLQKRDGGVMRIDKTGSKVNGKKGIFVRFKAFFGVK